MGDTQYCLPRVDMRLLYMGAVQAFGKALKSAEPVKGSVPAGECIEVQSGGDLQGVGNSYSTCAYANGISSQIELAISHNAKRFLVHFNQGLSFKPELRSYFHAAVIGNAGSAQSVVTIHQCKSDAARKAKLDGIALEAVEVLSQALGTSLSIREEPRAKGYVGDR